MTQTFSPMSMKRKTSHTCVDLESCWLCFTCATIFFSAHLIFGEKDIHFIHVIED